jgi:NAD(P)-dependent dehydrogenase (short-subunit alcohol dehydrogenase family)
MAQPSKIAACYVFLASDEASLVTGAVLAADGGGPAYRGRGGGRPSDY